jgi:hypothetical protein
VVNKQESRGGIETRVLRIIPSYSSADSSLDDDMMIVWWWLVGTRSVILMPAKLIFYCMGASCFVCR